MKKILFFSCLFIFFGCVSTPITGKKAFIITSEEEEASLGEQAYRQTLHQSHLSNQPQWNALIKRVGQRIAKASEQTNFKWEFKLIESTEKNAFCLPGGKVAFYTGIMNVFENEAQVAAVMGHEVAHATARHGGQRITMQYGTEIGFSVLNGFIGGKDSTEKTLLMQLLGAGATVGALLPFSRSHESEADHIGLVYVAKAGYDPGEASRFWKIFASGNEGPPEWLSTHPSPGNREENLRRLLPEVLPYYDRSAKYGLGEKLK